MLSCGVFDSDNGHEVNGECSAKKLSNAVSDLVCDRAGCQELLVSELSAGLSAVALDPGVFR